MLTKLLSVVVIIMSTFLAASAQNKIADNSYSSMPNSKEIMLEAVSVEESGFPSGEFSVANADYFITSFQKWTDANKAHYKDLLTNTTAGNKRIILLREEYYRLTPDQQVAYKTFLADRQKYLSMQTSVSGNDKKTYLFSGADFKKLQSIITK